MKKLIVLTFLSVFLYSCSSNAYKAEFEKNTETVKAYFKLHEEENAAAMFDYLHPDMEWHLPVYGMEIGGIEEVKAAALNERIHLFRALTSFEWTDNTLSL